MARTTGPVEPHSRNGEQKGREKQMAPFFPRQSAMQLAGAVCAAVLVLGGAIGASAAMGGGGFVEFEHVQFFFKRNLT